MTEKEKTAPRHRRARAERKPFDRKRKHPPRHQRARAERKPFDRKRKPVPRHRREKDLWFSFSPQKRTTAT
ncbi:MAG: hypothetical protein ACLT2X_15065 [Faecalibacterium prausnitzii]